MSSVEGSFLPFALPDIGEGEITEVVDSLLSGWITTGPKTKRFEAAFSDFLGGGIHSVAVNSATAGLHLAVEAAGIGPGDEVITTTHTFTATAEIVRYVGADVVLVDIDLDTYCISPAATAAAVTGKTKALLPVHYAGHGCDMASIMTLARRSSLKVIEDAAHALPTRMGQELVGTLDTDATVFSFYATKTLATGEGGMLVTRNADMARRARVMRLHGIDRDAFDRFTSNKPAWYYEVVAPGFKYNMTDLAAALGIHQLARIGSMHARRQQMAEVYDAALADLPLHLPPRPAGRPEAHAWHLYVVRLADDARISRDRVIEELYKRGIGSSVHYVPLHLQPYWRDRYGLKPESFPNSQKLYERALSLPLYTRMTEADQQKVIEALREIL